MASQDFAGPTSGNANREIIDMTDDSANPSSSMEQVSTPASVFIKKEPVEAEEPMENTQSIMSQHPPLPDLSVFDDINMDDINMDDINMDDINMDDINLLRLWTENQANVGDDNGIDITEIVTTQGAAEIGQNADPGDWDDYLDTDSSEADAMAAAAFAQRKEEYEQKKALGINTKADDCRFATDEAAELRRLRDIERSQMVVEEVPEQSRLPEGYVEEDSLFVPEAPPLPEPTARKRATPKPKNRLTAKEIRASIAIRSDADSTGGKRSRKRAASTGGTKQPSQKRSRKQRPNLSNIQSLGRPDIIRAAQANAARPDMPTFTSQNKAKALQELIASIPSADQGSHSSDRLAILEATKKFKGHGSVKSDGQGGWKLKGMESSLYHHQLLGAAFLRDRENGGAKPHGGLVCDEMGFGKTIQMIANILDGKAEEGSPVKTTLIIAPPALVTQWMHEMDKHVKGDALGRILRYHSGSRISSNNILADLMHYDVILTTYSEVQKGYPMPEPPKHLASEDKKNEWWAKFYRENVGPLHRIKFHRIVLDEAHHIKNHTSKTSIAVRALTGNFRWCITGTPILNYIEELYPYFSFLKVPHVGDFATFQHNFCDNRVNRRPIDMGRIHNILRAIMLRRTHVDSLFNAPVVKLPGIKHKTVLVYFNKIERHIYNMVKSKYVHQINTYSRSGELTSHYSNILAMLGRLRMLCSHIFLCQDTLRQLFTASDVETLWRMTAKEVEENNDDSQLKILAHLRKMLQSKENTIQTSQTKEAEPTIASAITATPVGDVEAEEDLDTGGNYGLTFKFRRFLRSLRTSSTWAELSLRSNCAKCRLPPDDPWCTSCFHVYCKECLNSMDFERKEEGEEKIACLDCGTHFEETSPCLGLKALEYDVEEARKTLEKRKNSRQKRSLADRRGSSVSTVEEEDEDWIELGGGSLPSAKLMATKAAILNWKQQFPNQKIIVYTQFLGLCRLLSKMCAVEGWGHALFHGKMTLEARDKAIERFRDQPDTFILICSLKAGGVGLNLNMASKVIILDLWFNSAVEAQAYCRAFRIGQMNHVEVLRFVVKDSIDEDLIDMQERKDLEVSGAIGPESHGKRATISQLLELFGEVKEEGQNEFILVEDDDDEGDSNTVEVVNRLPPRPF